MEKLVLHNMLVYIGTMITRIHIIKNSMITTVVCYIEYRVAKRRMNIPSFIVRASPTSLTADITLHGLQNVSTSKLQRCVN